MTDTNPGGSGCGLSQVVVLVLWSTQYVLPCGSFLCSHLKDTATQIVHKKASEGHPPVNILLFFYPGGRGSEDPALGTCCLGLAPSVGTVALLLLLLPPAPEAFASPSAGEEEDEDEAVMVVVAPWVRDVNVEETAAQSLGLAAEEETGACVEGG